MSADVHDDPTGIHAASGFAWRRREALRLDLEDEQKSLIEDLYHRARRLLARVRVPDDVGTALARSDLDAETARGLGLICEDTTRLRSVNRALEKLTQGIYGRCERCAVEMDLELLAADTTRSLCPACAGSGPAETDRS